MRLISKMLLLAIAALLVIGSAFPSSAADYKSRFMRDYPPGYYGMWYYAERFNETRPNDQTPIETYRWDRYMSRMTNLYYPFLPIPYDWDYGSHRNFNLPEYNTNDWWR